MGLAEEFDTQGQWLFRWRSYLPVVFIGLLGAAFIGFDWPLGSYRLHEWWEFLCLAISLSGLGVRVATIGHTPARTSGRNANRQIADKLNTTGMYSVARHPLYLGNFLIGLGIALVMFVWWLPVLYVLTFWLYYERIMFAEETFLRGKFGDTFLQWSNRTPAFWPRFSQWTRRSLPFSFRNVLRREYTGLIVVILGHTGVELAEHLIMEHRIRWEPFWTMLLVGGLAVYLALRMIKRHSTLLDVSGR